MSVFRIRNVVSALAEIWGEKHLNKSSLWIDENDIGNKGCDALPVMFVGVTFRVRPAEDLDLTDEVKLTFTWEPEWERPEFEDDLDGSTMFRTIDEVEAALPGISEWVITEAKAKLRGDREYMLSIASSDWKKGAYSFQLFDFDYVEETVTLLFDSIGKGGLNFESAEVPPLTPFQFRIEFSKVVVMPTPQDWIDFETLTQYLPGLPEVVREALRNAKQNPIG
jgi:hypothetical protein